MAYQFLIIDPFDGVPKGTNDPEVAADYAASHDYYVIDTAKNLWMTEGGDSVQIKDVQS